MLPDKYKYADINNAHMWMIEYTDIIGETEYTAVCKFESSDEQTAIISHLFVPEQLRNNGIGTELVEFAEQTIRKETEAEQLYIEIGANNGATEQLYKKCGFKIQYTDNKETIGKYVSGMKQLS